MQQSIQTHICCSDNFSKLKRNKKLLTYYTGFDDENVYKEFLEFINPEERHSFSEKISSENQIFLVLMKLRQGFDNSDLSARFNLGPKVVSNIFINWINIMYTRLGGLCIWPDRKDLLSCAPEAFKIKFPSTILILDCTELKIQSPSDLVKQSQSYSSYKSHNTLKGLVGCSPAGCTIFVSELYTGSISDKKITEECGLYDVLKKKLEVGQILPGDGIMIDKGFSIKEELKNLGLEINVPPMGTELQFSAADVQETRKIASCRVHVERAIRKIKTYKILKGVIPIKMIPHINQIWTVCALLSDFRCIINENFDNSSIINENFDNSNLQDM